MQPGGTRWHLNPSGKPAWTSAGHAYGDYYAFQLSYTASSGTTTWQLDFTGDGDFDDEQERVTNVSPLLAGKGFQFINITYIRFTISTSVLVGEKSDPGTY